jgi:long-chain acyl-CoA synthetase
MATVVADAFDVVCRAAGERRAVVDEGRPLSYFSLLRWSEAISTQLERLEPMVGRRVALVFPNSAAFIASFFAVARVGGIVAPLNHEYRSQELDYYLTDINAAVVLVASSAASRIQEALGRVARKPALVLVDSSGTCEVMTRGDGSADHEQRSDESSLLLLYTSGSTGKPKRVVRTHGQLLAEIETLRTLFDVTSRDRFLGATPFCHVNGLVRSMMNAMLAGATLYPINQFARRTVLATITMERLTFFGGVPPMFVLLAQTPLKDPIDMSSLRIVFSSSAPLTAADNHEFQKTYKLFVRQLYGSTETGTISYNNYSEPGEHLESVGRPLPGVSVSVIDEGGTVVLPGIEGEVVVSSPFAASRYDGNVTATEKSFRDGFYVTGDLGVLDSDGCLTLTGRKSFMINRGGFKVNPHEVEEAIRQHSKVVDVAVIGAPGRHGQEIVRCLVVVRSACSPDEIILHCQGRIADYKIPSRIEFRESLPRTSTGKLRRQAL